MPVNNRVKKSWNDDDSDDNFVVAKSRPKSSEMKDREKIRKYLRDNPKATSEHASAIRTVLGLKRPLKFVIRCIVDFRASKKRVTDEMINKIKAKFDEKCDANLRAREKMAEELGIPKYIFLSWFQKLKGTRKQILEETNKRFFTTYTDVQYTSLFDDFLQAQRVPIKERCEEIGQSLELAGMRVEKWFTEHFDRFKFLIELTGDKDRAMKIMRENARNVQRLNLAHRSSPSLIPDRPKRGIEKVALGKLLETREEGTMDVPKKQRRDIEIANTESGISEENEARIREYFFRCNDNVTANHKQIKLLRETLDLPIGQKLLINFIVALRREYFGAHRVLYIPPSALNTVERLFNKDPKSSETQKKEIADIVNLPFQCLNAWWRQRAEKIRDMEQLEKWEADNTFGAITTEQLAALENVFETDNNPKEYKKMQLAREMKMDKTLVKTWFEYKKTLVCMTREEAEEEFEDEEEEKYDDDFEDEQDPLDYEYEDEDIPSTSTNHRFPPLPARRQCLPSTSRSTESPVQGSRQSSVNERGNDRMSDNYDPRDSPEPQASRLAASEAARQSPVRSRHNSSAHQELMDTNSIDSTHRNGSPVHNSFVEQPSCSEYPAHQDLDSEPPMGSQPGNQEPPAANPTPTNREPWLEKEINEEETDDPYLNLEGRLEPEQWSPSRFSMHAEPRTDVHERCHKKTGGRKKKGAKKESNENKINTDEFPPRPRSVMPEIQDNMWSDRQQRLGPDFGDIPGRCVPEIYQEEERQFADRDNVPFEEWTVFQAGSFLRDILPRSLMIENHDKMIDGSILKRLFIREKIGKTFLYKELNWNATQNKDVIAKLKEKEKIRKRQNRRK